MENFIYCNEEEIRNYLLQFGRGPESHDYELSEAVRLKRFYDSRLNRAHLIGIPVSTEGLRLHQKGSVSKDQAIHKYQKQDTEVDVLIIDAEDCDSSPRDRFRGDVFQIKRMEEDYSGEDFTTTTTKVLQRILSKNYAPSPYLSLYIAINRAFPTQEVKWEEIVNFLQTQNVPFLRILIGPIHDTHQKDFLVQVFPNLESKRMD